VDLETIDRTLDLLTPEEIQQALWFVAVCERKGTMRRAAADEWRRRILARQRFLELEGTSADDR